MMNKVQEAPRYPMPRTSPFDPPPLYAELRAQRPMSRVTLWDGSQAWLATRYKDYRTIARDPRFSADPTRPGYPSAQRSPIQRQNRKLNLDAPAHDTYRAMVMKYFTLSRTEEMRPDIERIASEVLTAMVEKGSPADLVAQYGRPIASQVVCQILGVPYADREIFQAHIRALQRLSHSPEEATELSLNLRSYLLGLVEARALKPENDLISGLIVEYGNTGALTHTEVADMANHILQAGHETTANMIALGILTLMQHPDQVDELREDPSLVKAATDELLRYLTITQFTSPRVALEDLEVSGQVIRAGEGVVALAISANRDEEAFPNADTFDIHRKSRHHVAFGHGVHVCLGQHVARAELLAAFATIIEKLPTLRLAIPLDEVRFRTDMEVYGVHELPVIW
jgi:cytochrome P450